MTAGGVTKITLGAANYKVKLVNLTNGYSTSQTEYDILATEPQLTICLDANLVDGSSTGVRYALGSIIYDYSFTYYNPDGNVAYSSFKEILQTKKGIMLNFYFNGCPPCNTEMPALVAASNENLDIQVLMVNYYGYGDTNEVIQNFQKNKAANSTLGFLNVASSRIVYSNFSSIATNFPTTVLIDCNGQVVYFHVGSMTQTAFNSAFKTYLHNRYEKLHPSTQTASFDVTKYEVILPSSKFELVF